MEVLNQVLLKYIKSGNIILDFGCGQGSLGAEMKKKGNIVHGVDISTENVEIARSKLDNAIIGDCRKPESLPFEEKSYDVVVLSDVLEHLSDPLTTLKDVKRYLNDNGYLLISIPNVASWTIRLGLLFGFFNYKDFGILDKTHIKFFTLKSSRQLISDAGLEILKTDATPNFLLAIAPLMGKILKMLSLSQEQKQMNACEDEREEMREGGFLLGLFAIYQRVIFPLEHFFAKLWKALFALQFVFVVAPKSTSVNFS